MYVSLKKYPLACQILNKLKKKSDKKVLKTQSIGFDLIAQRAYAALYHSAASLDSKLIYKTATEFTWAD